MAIVGVVILTLGVLPADIGVGGHGRTCDLLAVPSRPSFRIPRR
ncbi:hypothetical protein ACF064_35375 [Streptomyces sp. NPDC015492]